MARKERDESVELEIERLDTEARGVGRSPEGQVVFVPDALPGQRVRVRLGKRKKTWAEARLLEVLRPGTDQVEPRCVHFWTCGGCRLQHLDYPAQLAAKTAQVRDALVRLGHFPDPPVEDCEPSPDVYGYRNKMEYSFGDRRWLDREEMEARWKREAKVLRRAARAQGDASGAKEAAGGPAKGSARRDGRTNRDRDFALGLHPRARWDRVIQLEECHLPEERSVEVLRHVQEATLRSRRGAYSTRTHQGYWRFLVVRQGVRTGQWLVDLITAPSREGHGEVEALARSLQAVFPDLTTITHTISSSKAAVATGEEHRVLYGPGYIEDQVGGLTFRLSPRAFFQTNTAAAERLYTMAVEAAGLTGTERIFDVYCGTGTIALLLAASSAEVVGCEVVSEAVADARENAERNGITNARFVEGDAALLLREMAADGKPDVVVFDPPRAGLHPDARADLLNLLPERVVYVSCHAATLARDLREFVDGGYRLEQVRPIDLFPHTAHVESVARLTKV